VNGMSAMFIDNCALFSSTSKANAQWTQTCHDEGKNQQTERQ